MQPGRLFIPTRPRDSSGTVHVETRELTDGRIALPAYSSLEQLVHHRSERQPWIAVNDEGLQELHNVTGYDVVLLDAAGPAPKEDFGPSDDELGGHIPRSILHQPYGTYRAKRRGSR